MEEFARELKAGGSLFLLYGESGVGKTRILRELGQSRLAGSRIHWLDLSEGNGGENTPQDNNRLVQSIFESAQQGDIVIADHFEMALKKTRHQLFLSWSTDGVDKQLNLIVASSIEGFTELRQLSQHYQVSVQSFQQMPFSADEVHEFVGFYLFPEQPIGNLSISPTLRRRLAATNGAVGRIIEVIERDSAEVSSSLVSNSASIRRGSRIIATVFILFGLALGVGWYYLGNQSEVAELAPELATTESGSMTKVESVIVAEPEAEPETMPDSTNETAEQGVPSAETGSVADVEAVIVDGGNSAGQLASLSAATAVSNDPGQFEPSTASWFQRELKVSYDWVTSSAESIGTMQIMVLGFKTFDEAVYHGYVESLASKGVDTAQLRIFKTYTGGARYYSVVYGEYASRRAANQAKGSLPEALRKTSPIARSVGGILQEIRRLETES
jgi:hypothetical protein